MSPAFLSVTSSVSLVMTLEQYAENVITFNAGEGLPVFF
jgi:hypothetical protein